MAQNATEQMPVSRKQRGSVEHATIDPWALRLALSASNSSSLAAAASYATGDPSYARQHALGFSGVVFALCVAEAGRSPNAKRSIFGVVEVPARLSPWALLLALLLALPLVAALWSARQSALVLLAAAGYRGSSP